MNFARSKCDRRVTQGVMRQRGFSLRLGNQRLPRQAKIRSASYQPRSRCAIQPSRLRTAISASRALLLIHRESPFRKNGNPRRRIPAIRHRRRKSPARSQAAQALPRWRTTHAEPRCSPTRCRGQSAGRSQRGLAGQVRDVEHQRLDDPALWRVCIATQYN